MDIKNLLTSLKVQFHEFPTHFEILSYKKPFLYNKLFIRDQIEDSHKIVINDMHYKDMYVTIISKENQYVTESLID